MIPRAAFAPIAIAMVIATLLTAFFSHLFLDAEFHDAKWIVDSHPPLPYPTAFLGAIYPFIWLLPLFTCVFAFVLFRRPELRVAHVTWFGSSVALALFFWYLLIVVAFLCIYSQSGHYNRPLGGR
jgi:hypothetical protein